jgi:hypothetical protein
MNLDKINWVMLSENPNVIHYLEQNKDRIYWNILSFNPNAIHLLRQNKNNINWGLLSRNPNAIHLLEQNQDIINWNYLSKNPNIFEFNYIKMSENKIKIILEEIMKNVWHPKRIIRYLESGGNLDDF